MDFKEFEEALIEIIKERVGDNTKISIHIVSKNNGIKLTGLVIMNAEENVSPTIYLEPFFEMACKGKNLGDIAEEILVLCSEQKKQFIFDVEEFQNISVTGKKILYKLINYDKNKELLEQIPHRRWMDLAIVYYVLVSCDELGSGTILVKNEHMMLWKITEEELYTYASKNTPFIMKKTLKSMADVIMDFMKDNVADSAAGAESAQTSEKMKNTIAAQELDDNAPIRMYVMGNQMKLNGACTVLYENTLAEFSKSVDMDFYILPSSIHEVILVPADRDVDEAALLSLVREVNENNVTEEEWLSNNIYRYFRDENEVKLIS